MTALALLWARFMASPIGRWAAIIGAALLAVLTFGRMKKREGRKEAAAHANELALEREAIRRRIGDDHGRSVDERLRGDFRD